VIFKNFEYSLGPGETPNNSASTRFQTICSVLKYRKKSLKIGTVTV